MSKPPRPKSAPTAAPAASELVLGLTQLFTRVVIFAVDGVNARVVRTHGIVEGLVGRTISLVEPTALRWAVEAASPVVDAGRSPTGLDLSARLDLAPPRAFAVVPLVLGGRLRALAYGDCVGEPLQVGQVAEVFAWCNRLLGNAASSPPPARWMFGSTGAYEARRRSPVRRAPVLTRPPRALRPVEPAPEEEHARVSEPAPEPAADPAPAPPPEPALESPPEPTLESPPEPTLESPPTPAPTVELELELALPEHDVAAVSFAPRPAELAPPVPPTVPTDSRPREVAVSASQGTPAPRRTRESVAYRQPTQGQGARRAVFWTAASLAFVVASVVLLLSPPRAREATLVVTLHEPATAAEVAHALGRAGLVRSTSLTQLLLAAGEAPQAGSYLAPTGRWPWRLLSALRQAAPGLRTVSFPPGATLSELATELSRSGLFGEDEVLDASRELALRERWGIDGPSVEGFLLPGTYKLSSGLAPREVLDILVGEHFRRLRALPAAVHLGGAALRDLVTLASIVERETQDKDELARMAGVFANRLKKGMRLESPATVRFILGEPKERLSVEDVRQPSPYNTYLSGGLPPGPIGNPSAAALRAALEPEEHDLLYFVELEDGSGRHAFSRTYAEHLEAQRAARR